MKQAITAEWNPKLSFTYTGNTLPYVRDTAESVVYAVKPYHRRFKKGTPLNTLFLRKHRKHVRSRMNKDARRNVVELS